jgi:hypothetical protein
MRREKAGKGRGIGLLAQIGTVTERRENRAGEALAALGFGHGFLFGRRLHGQRFLFLGR